MKQQKIFKERIYNKTKVNKSENVKVENGQRREKTSYIHPNRVTKYPDKKYRTKIPYVFVLLSFYLFIESIRYSQVFSWSFHIVYSL